MEASPREVAGILVGRDLRSRCFQARGVRRGYYTDTREDALIMWKDPVQEHAHG